MSGARLSGKKGAYEYSIWLLRRDYDAQEWAAHNGVPVPHKEGRVNNSLLYKGMEEDTPTNILQVQSSLSLLHSGTATFRRLLRPLKEALCCRPQLR